MHSCSTFNVVVSLLRTCEQDQSSDPNIGSSRGNASTETSKVLNGLGVGNSTSASALVSTLVPALVVACFWFGLFIICRRSQIRWYAPRTHLPSLHSQYVFPTHIPPRLSGYSLCISERSPALPSGWVNWFWDFLQISDAHVLHHSSLDGYLFLRFLRVLCTTCATGCLITWPVLFPIHVTGGAGNTELDALSFGNVTNPKRYYAHVVIGITFFCEFTSLFH